MRIVVALGPDRKPVGEEGAVVIGELEPKPLLNTVKFSGSQSWTDSRVS